MQNMNLGSNNSIDNNHFKKASLSQDSQDSVYGFNHPLISDNPSMNIAQQSHTQIRTTAANQDKDGGD